MFYCSVQFSRPCLLHIRKLKFFVTPILAFGGEKKVKLSTIWFLNNHIHRTVSTGKYYLNSFFQFSGLFTIPFTNFCTILQISALWEHGLNPVFPIKVAAHYMLSRAESLSLTVSQNCACCSRQRRMTLLQSQIRLLWK